MDLSNENVIQIKKENIEYLQFKKLLEYPEIKHLYSLGITRDYRTAKANNEKIDIQKYNQAIQNYKDLCNEINEPPYTKVIKANQTHSDNIKIINQKQIDKNTENKKIETAQNADSLITNEKDIILATTNADCILFLLYDTENKVIANVHSGWRGTVQRIAIKTVQKMQKEFNSKPENIICCICPSIRKCHFEVGKEVKEIFQDEFKDIDLDKVIEETKPKEKWHIDTIEINKILLKRLGLKEENIIDSKICSVCNHNIIHSYRMEKEKYGLETAIIEKIN